MSFFMIRTCLLDTDCDDRGVRKQTADHRRDHREEGIIPIRRALARNRQHSVADAWPEIAGRIDSIGMLLIKMIAASPRLHGNALKCSRVSQPICRGAVRVGPGSDLPQMKHCSSRRDHSHR
jgi:hypothetical protein